MQNLNNLNNLNALGIKGNRLFDPSQITVGGQKTLLQQVLTKRVPTLNGVVYDERKNKGTPRPIQQGRCYNFDGTNDEVIMGSALSLFNDSTNTWRIKFNVNFSSVTGIRRIIAQQQGPSQYRGFSIYLNGTSLRVDMVRTVTTDQLTVLVSSFTPVIGTNYEIDITYNGNKTNTGFTIVINGVTYSTTAGPNSLTSSDITSGGTLRIGSDGTTSGSNFFSGKLWGVQIWNGTGTLVAMYKCDEQGSTMCLDSSGNGNNGTITNATLATFHSTQDVYSYQNEIGYCDAKNYWKYTQEFNASNWTKNGGSVTSISRPDPLGGSLASEFTEDNTTGNHRFFQGSTFAIGSTYTMSVYLKYRNRQYVGLIHAGANVSIVCDLISGNIVSSSGTIIASGMQNMGDGWYRCYVTAVSVNSGTQSSIIAGCSTSGGTLSYTGNSLPAFDIFGTQIELGTLTSYQRNILLEAGNKIPRNENNTSFNVFGYPLTYSGQVPYDADLEQSNCVVFDGVNDNILISSKSQLVFQNGDFSISFRAKCAVSDITADMTLASKWAVGNYEWNIVLTTTERLIFYTSDGTNFPNVATVNPINVNNWNTYTITKTGTTAKVYVNGVEFAITGTPVASMTNGVSAISLGTRPDGTIPFQGNMCDFRIYNTNLSAQRALDIHNGVDSGSSLVVYLPMAEGFDTYTYDVSGNSNNAILANGTTWAKQDIYHYNMVKGISKYTHLNGSSVSTNYTNKTLYSVQFDFYTKSAINSSTTGIGAFNGSSLVNTFGIGLGICTGLLTNEVITIFNSGQRTGVTDITIPAGYHTIKIEWNGTRYDIFLDGVIQTVTFGTSTGHCSLFTTSDRVTFGQYGSLLSYSDIMANMIVKSDATTEFFRVAGNGKTAIELFDVYGATLTHNAQTVYIPALNTTTDIFGKTLKNPAGAYHNGAETLIDFTNNVLSPEAVRNSWETAWAFNSARTNPEFRRTLTLATVAHRNDRFLAYRDALTGANLSKVNKYVTTKSI